MSTDEKSWKVWENTFADKFTIDFGGVKPPQKTTPKDLMDWAKKTYATVDIHLDGDQATSKSYGHARHERTANGDFWHIYATYEHEHVRTPKGLENFKDQDDAQLPGGKFQIARRNFCAGDEIMSAIRITSRIQINLSPSDQKWTAWTG